MPARIRKGDTVMAISGKDKGRTGTVLEVRPKEDRVVVEGLNVQKRHTRPRPPEEPGGVIDPMIVSVSSLKLQRGAAAPT